MMKRYPGISKASQNRFFEAVHQELAPLARQLERELNEALGQSRVPDAAIAACALMIKGICMVRPQEAWTAEIEKRIRFMLAATADAAIKSGSEG
jgi:hypothetical protein